MKVEWDFSEITKFANRLNNSQLDMTFERIAKDIANALLKRMKYDLFMLRLLI